jgi:hypothetical protein
MPLDWRTENSGGSFMRLAGGSVILKIGYNPITGEWYAQIGSGPKALLPGCMNGEEARRAAVPWFVDRSHELVAALTKDVQALVEQEAVGG